MLETVATTGGLIDHIQKPACIKFITHCKLIVLNVMKFSYLKHMVFLFEKTLNLLKNRETSTIRQNNFRCYYKFPFHHCGPIIAIVSFKKHFSNLEYFSPISSFCHLIPNHFMIACVILHLSCRELKSRGPILRVTSSEKSLRLC